MMSGCVVSEQGVHALMWLCSLNFLCVFLCMMHDLIKFIYIYEYMHDSEQATKMDQ